MELELNRLREEQKHCITNLQAAYELEKNKARIARYPALFTIIGKLSHKAKIPATAEKAKDIAEELNDWLYSAGGMCAEPSSRGASSKTNEKDACNIGQELLKKLNHGSRIRGLRLQSKVQIISRADCTERREMFVGQFDAQNRRLPNGGKGADRHWQHIATRCIQPQDGGLLFIGFFLARAT